MTEFDQIYKILANFGQSLAKFGQRILNPKFGFGFGTQILKSRIRPRLVDSRQELQHPTPFHSTLLHKKTVNKIEPLSQTSKKLWQLKRVNLPVSLAATLFKLLNCQGSLLLFFPFDCLFYVRPSDFKVMLRDCACSTIY